MYHSIQLVRKPTREQPGASEWRAGDWVQVRSREEILATLDERGRLDGMPFMPEMLAYCGKRLRVSKRAHKTCDTVTDPSMKSGNGRRGLERTVHLADARCDGKAHGGCEAGCNLYWKEAWLRPAAAPGATPNEYPGRDSTSRPTRGCTTEQLEAATRIGCDAVKGPRYACQATQLLNATKRLSSYELRQYVEDYRSGNVSLATFLHGTVYRTAFAVVRRAERLGKRIGVGDAIANALMACYDALARLVPNGVPYPRRKGIIPLGQPTPEVSIGQLGPGSRVRVKSYQEILSTLNTENKTRGLAFDAEHVPYCGKEFTVHSLVQQIINEQTGYMMRFKTPSVILQGVYCQGTFGMFCPRAIYPYWRPAWLTPVGTDLEVKPSPPQAVDSRRCIEQESVS
jgi:hypothetical protein